MVCRRHADKLKAGDLLTLIAEDGSFDCDCRVQ